MKKQMDSRKSHRKRSILKSITTEVTDHMLRYFRPIDQSSAPFITNVRLLSPHLLLSIGPLISSRVNTKDATNKRIWLVISDCGIALLSPSVFRHPLVQLGPL
jgi:hypothetical protein